MWFDYRVESWEWTHSWSVSGDLAQHLVLVGSYWDRYVSSTIPGAVIFANWNGNNFYKIGHAGIVTKVANGTVYITQHTRNTTEPFAAWQAGHPNLTVWIARAHQG